MTDQVCPFNESTSVGSEQGSPCESEDIEESCSGTPVAPSAPAKVPKPDGKPEAVVSPVPTGKAAEGGLSKEARLREEAESVRHLLTHLPKNPYCPACQCGKLVKVHHRRRIPQEDAAASFGDKCTADTLFAKGEHSQGRCGEKYAVVILDLATDWVTCAPVCERSGRDAEEALRMFAGPDAEIKSFYSDNANELRDAAQSVKW